MRDANPTATVSVDGGTARVDVGGYISDTGADVLAPALAAAATQARIVVVFAAGSMISSTGIAVLLDLLLPRRERGMDVRIVHPAAHFRRVFAIVGLAASVPVFDSPEKALAARWHATALFSGPVTVRPPARRTHKGAGGAVVARSAGNETAAPGDLMSDRARPGGIPLEIRRPPGQSTARSRVGMPRTCRRSALRYQLRLAEIDTAV